MNDTYVIGTCYLCKQPCGEECFGYAHQKCTMEKNAQWIKERKEKKRVKKIKM